MILPLHGWWLGGCERDEFRPLREWYRQHASHVTMHNAITVAEFVTAVSVGSSPDLVIVTESEPDEFTASDISQLLTIAPLARMICITGAWSETVGRTRSHWPAAWRVPLCDAIPRLERELAAISACRTGATGVTADLPPWTASRQETWLWQSSTSHRARPISGTVCLSEIADPTLAAELVAQCHTAGLTVVTTDAEVVVLDAEPWCAAVRDRIVTAMARHPHSTPLAITGWNTPDVRGELATLGVSHVADKLNLQSLMGLIESVLPSRNHQEASSA